METGPREGGAGEPQMNLGRSNRWTAVLLVWVAAVLGAAGATSAVRAESPGRLNIGFQKSSLNLIVLKSRGTLDRRLEPLRVTVTWTEFPAGPQLLEALSTNSVDFGMTGDTPPIFAQAAGTDLVYVGNEPPKPDASAIVVKESSPISSLSDLRGKRIAFTKGSSAHYLVVRALAAADLDYKDITPAYLSPAEARAAFEAGSVDAWVVWDPYLAAAEKALSLRTIKTGKGLVSNHTFYLANRSYASTHEDVIAVVFDELSRNERFLRENPKEVARILAKYTGLDVPTLERVLERRPSFRVSYIEPRVVDEQQTIADTFQRLNLIPKTIVVNDVVWRPVQAQVRY
jgi:sulfonate transport system substrate-binding protein